MNQKILWGVTVVVAILMLGGAVFIARQRAVIPVPVVEMHVVAEEEAAPEPVQEAASETPEPVPEPESAPTAPVVYDEVRVDLSKIAGTLKMSSPDIPAGVDGQSPRYPLALTCYRKNVSPVLHWNGAPAATKSYVLVLERRAPNEKASWSWVMFNLPGASTDMPGNMTLERLVPGQGLFGTNPYGHQAYTGPCEPKGIFPYVLRLFALDTELDLPAGASLADILPAMNGHVVDAAEIKADHYLRM